MVRARIEQRRVSDEWKGDKTITVAGTTGDPKGLPDTVEEQAECLGLLLAVFEKSRETGCVYAPF